MKQYGLARLSEHGDDGMCMNTGDDYDHMIEMNGIMSIYYCIRSNDPCSIETNFSTTFPMTAQTLGNTQK